VIITQYDMPRKDTHPHDSDVDSKGRVWYTDQSAPFLGMLDPKTGTFTEYPMPEAKTKPLTGGSDIQIDKDDNPWFPMIHDSVDNHFGLLHKFDVKTKQFVPSKLDSKLSYQFVTIDPSGKIWTGLSNFIRVDPKTMEVDWSGGYQGSPALPKGKPHGIGYDLAVDSDGNPYKLSYSSDALIKVDVKTKEVKFYPTPTPISAPRRGEGDSKGRIWFGEYVGDKLGMFDAKTEKMTEYDPGIKYFANYTASGPDKFDRVYSPSNTADRIMRADAKTGEVVVYLMPTMDFDTKQLSIDPVSGTALLFANTRNARIVKLEPLD
jgi:virginiamycin B lyase